MMKLMRAERPADLGQQALLKGEAAAAMACVGTAPSTLNFFIPFLAGGRTGDDSSSCLKLPR